MKMPVKCLCVVISLLMMVGAAHAQSSLGIGGAEQSLAPAGGPFSEILIWIADKQREFYRAMTLALKEMRSDGSAVWLLIGLSFLYGILHAAGPGHGKVVISSYMVANETALKRGVLLSLVSSMLQAVSAIVIVGAGYLLLRGTSVSMTDAADWMETVSYALIALFGLWLFISKARRLLRAAKAEHHSHAHNHHHHHDHSHDHAHSHDEGQVCETCGHAHMPDPKQLAGDFSWRSASAAVLSVGLRPCSGAVIVLSFALLNGLYIGGIVSVFAMALGTAITVSALATLAVTAKNTALRFTRSPIMNARLNIAIELGAAVLIILLGGLMLAANLSA